MNDINKVTLNSGELLLLSFEQFKKFLQTNRLIVEEEKVYESVMMWVKNDLTNRLQFLPELIKHVNMLLIPISYFIDYIENEEILRLHCSSFLYETLKMYVIYNYGVNDRHRTRRKNQLILIASYTNGEYNLKWMETENEKMASKNFTWSTFNSTIIKDGRIFCVKQNVDNCFWHASIFDGIMHSWNSIGRIEFDNDKGVCSNLVQLDECIYMLSPFGCFKRYHYNKKQWQNLGQLTDEKPKFRNLIALNELIYCILVELIRKLSYNNVHFLHSVNIFSDPNCAQISKNKYLLQTCVQSRKWQCNAYFSSPPNSIDINISVGFLFKYDPVQNAWLVVSQKDFSKWYGYATCSLDGYLYMFGGIKKGECLKLAVKYNTSTNTWYDIADMIFPRWNAGAVAVNGLIYVMGGNNCDSFEVYDPESNVWTLSDVKLGSDQHQRTRVFVLDPMANINSANISDYYHSESHRADETDGSE